MNTQDPKYLERRAKEGLKQFEDAMRYYEGKGVPRDYEKAVRLFFDSAQKDHAHAADAKFYLGKMCLEGKGVEKMKPEEIERMGEFSLKNAANKDHVGAQLYLGEIYSKGGVVERNVVEAYEWYKMAAAQGNEEAIKKLDELEKEMTLEEVAEAQRGPFG